jgi:predicted metal-dependent hydrolase
MINYSLTRSKRKTVAIYIRHGAVEVRAPAKMPKHEIEKFINSKAKWIADKLAMTSEQAKQRESFCLTYGSMIQYRGKDCPIIAKEGEFIGFADGCFYMPPDLSRDDIKNAAIQLYRALAKRYITSRVATFAARMSAAPSAVKINGAKARWGSCSSSKSLNFSWRLIMADDEVIDYVVIHELAHMTEMNHSPRFWAIVESVLPDYKIRQKRLKELQKRLATESWSE